MNRGLPVESRRERNRTGRVEPLAGDPAIQGRSPYGIIVTAEREYHLVENVCVGVRERKSGRWLLSHKTLNLRAGGSVLCEPDRHAFLPGAPRVGEAMWFETGQRQRPLQIGSVLGVERPAGITSEFLLQLAARAAVAVQRPQPTAPAQRPAQASRAAQEGVQEPAARVNTVNLRPRRLSRAGARPSLAVKKVFRLFCQHSLAGQFPG